METRPEHLVFLGVKIPAGLLREIRRQAQADDRTVSGYLRRLLAQAVEQQAARQQSERQS